MEKFTEFMDLKRWLLLVLPFLIVIAVFLYLNFFKLNEYSEKYNFSNYFGDYKAILNLEPPVERTFSLNAEIFNLFYLIPFKEKSKIPPPIKINKENETKSPPPAYKIQLIYIRDGKKYVIIDGKLFTEGAKISDKEYIQRIEQDGVLLNGYWGARWIKF
jgi:hypothetical protein